MEIMTKRSTRKLCAWKDVEKGQTLYAELNSKFQAVRGGDDETLNTTTLRMEERGGYITRGTQVGFRTREAFLQ